MNRLSALQDGFQAYLLGDDAEHAFRTAIVDDSRVGAIRRLGIYHDAYRLRLIEALSKAYPKLGSLLGDDLFDRMARSFIAAHPSAFRNLRWYGGELAAHLAAELPGHPIASELAALEWRLALAFDAEDASTRSVADLASVPPEDWGALRFTLHPSVRTLDLTLNTVAVWKALDEDQTPPLIEHVPGAWLVWRKILNPYFRSLDNLEKQALGLALQGACFADICDALSHSGNEETAIGQAAQYLAAWLDDALIAHLD